MPSNPVSRKWNYRCSWINQPRLQAYARETVIAEKFQAMVMLGRAQQPPEGFYDIWSLSRSYDFEGSRLARASVTTFERRKTALPTELPDALTSTFAQDPMKRRQWEALLRDISGQATSLEEVVRDLASFLMPHVARARGY